MRVFLDLVVYVNWSTMLNFADLLTLQIYYSKCLQAIIVSAFFTTFWWLFSLILKLFSALPTYCLLHRINFIKYITQKLAQFTLWNTLNIFFWLGIWLVLVFVFSKKTVFPDQFKLLPFLIKNLK